VSIPQATREIAQRWRDMSEEAKLPFYKSAELDRERYQSEMAVWQPKANAAKVVEDQEADAALYDANGKKKRGRKPRPRAPEGQPQRAKSAYIAVLCEKREAVISAHPGMSFTEVTKHLAEQWRNMSPDLKKPYQDKGDANRVEYASAKKEWDSLQEAKAFERLEKFTQMVAKTKKGFEGAAPEPGASEVAPLPSPAT